MDELREEVQEFQERWNSMVLDITEDLKITCDEAQTVLEAGVQVLKERSALASRLIELATVCLSREPIALIPPSDGRLLLCAAFAAEFKKQTILEEPPFQAPPRWTCRPVPNKARI